MSETRPTVSIIVSSCFENRVLDFSKNQIRIGRARSSDVCLKDEEVAALHAVIEDAGDGFYIMDLGSLTGTIVNGKRTNKAPLRKTGDIIRVGRTTLTIILKEPSKEVPEAPSNLDPTRKSIDPRPWEEFLDSGLLWCVNRGLHIFGWAFVLEYDEDILTRVYPAKVSYTGFTPEVDEEGSSEDVHVWAERQRKKLIELGNVELAQTIRVAVFPEGYDLDEINRVLSTTGYLGILLRREGIE